MDSAYQSNGEGRGHQRWAIYQQRETVEEKNIELPGDCVVEQLLILR